ncbi:MAG TPA: autotransporter outer membrane beta-barrel domain-containing protein [Rickettsia endosymbiont of Pyrocoelia pectoralis]|nr:autotransporter outer membrane beta-barrel domain-containing protein [Rickettsia endosymbiont of Pyrocoelia pectoralis]
MTNISPKLFQKAITKGLKTTLFTTSTMALMLSSSGALGAAVNVTAPATVRNFAVDGASVGLDANFNNGDSLTLTGNFSIDTGGNNIQISAVNTGVFANQLFTVSHDQIDIGGNLGMNLTLTAAAGGVTVGLVGAGDVNVAGGLLAIGGAAGQDVTITGGQVNQGGAITGNLDVSGGGIYDGTAAANVGGTVNVQATAGAVTINNATGNVTVAGSTLEIVDAEANMTITGGTVTQTGEIGGNLNVSGGGNLAGTAGTTDVTGTVTLQATAGIVTIRDALNAGPVNVAGGTLNLRNAANNMTITGGTVTQTGAITGDLDVSNGGVFTGVAANVGGTVNVQATAGAVTINDATGNVTVAGSTLAIADAKANMTITGGTVTQTGEIIGNLDISGGGNLEGTAGATDVTGTVTLQADAGAAAINNANGVVTIQGGVLLLKNATNGIEFAGAAAAGTAVNVRTGGDVQDVDNTTGADGKGTLTFQGAGTANDIGNTNSLAVVNIDAGEVIITGVTMKADAINLTDDASELTFTNSILVEGAIDNTGNASNGIVNFQDDITVTGNIGATNPFEAINIAAGTATLNGAVIKADTVNLNDPASILTLTNAAAVLTGDIDNTTGGNGVGTLNSNGLLTEVTGSIGATNSLEAINIAAGATLQVGGNVAATSTSFAAGSILEFNDATANASHTFKGAIVNGANATLNVNTDNLVAYDPTIGTVAQINIGANRLFQIDASSGDVTILTAQAINFGDANSVLAFSNLTGGAAKNILLANNLAAFGTGGGSLIFDGGARGIKIGSSVVNTVRTIGDAGGDKFNTLSIYNQAEVTKDINLAGIQNLVINDNGAFLDSGGTSANIANITINDGVYGIDASGGNINVPAANITFNDPDAKLGLINTSTTDDRTITLAADISPNDDDEGVVVLSSVEAGRKLTIAGGKILGGAHRLKAIVFNGAGDFDTSAVTLKTTNIGIGTTGAIALGATPANVTIENDAAKLTQTGNIGGYLDFNGKNGTVTLNPGVNVVGAVQNTKGNNNGTLIALGASNLGSVNGITMLKVGAGAVTIGGAGGDIKIGEIQGNGTELLILPTNFRLTGGFNKTGGTALKLSFADGGSVSDVVGTAANPIGDITLVGKNSFANTVNSNGVMTLAKNSVTTFAKDVTAASFVANGAAMDFDSNLALNGNIAGSGTTLDLGVNQVTYTGTGSFTDTLTLETILDGAAKSGGNILIKSGSTLDLSGVSSLVVNITPINFNINNIDENSQYKVISTEAAGGLIPTSSDKVKVAINNQNIFVGITFDTSSLTLFAEDIAEEVIDDLFAPGGELANIPEAAAIKRSLELMDQAPNGSDAREALDNLGDLPLLQIVDAVNRLRQNSVKPSETIAACSQAVSGNILGNLTSINARIDKTQAAAMAAGDEDMNAQFGGWINPFIGNATQKKIQNISGYKSDTTGGTLGFDALINDDAVLGLAYTRAETDVKMKDAKQGDKNKVRSNIFSLYGLYNLPQSNFFVEGVASYGDSKVTSKSRLIVSVNGTMGYQTAKGKYKSENYTGQLMAGYNYALPETVSAMPLTVTPMAGVRYSDIKDKGYKETGTTFQNLTVKGKNYNTFDGLAGAKLSSSINTGEVVLTPEFYAMVDYAFKNKAPAIDARLQGMTAPFPTNSFKPKKTSFDLGTGVTIKHKMVEYGVNYDVNIGNKYFAQQGSVKVRVNF